MPFYPKVTTFVSYFLLQALYKTFQHKLQMPDTTPDFMSGWESVGQSASYHLTQSYLLGQNIICIILVRLPRFHPFQPLTLKQIYVSTAQFKLDFVL